jgi:GxxExxY protein
MNELIYKDECYKIIGAAFEVYNALKPGFLEAVYQEALEIELSEKGIPFVSQPELIIYYKDRPLKKHYFGDFLVFGAILVEIKAIDKLTSREQAQLINEIKAAKLRLGILINFGHPDKLEWDRMAY